MFDCDKKKRVIAGVSAGFILVVGLSFGIFYQPQAKTDKIFSSALEEFSNGDYQNAYYLFSKVTVF